MRLNGIQYLRGLAALMVVLYHLGAQSQEFHIPQINWLQTGVDVFFVISGFIMVVTSNKLAAGEFIRRRLVRIVPIYWALTLAVFVASAIAILRHLPPHHSPADLAKSLLFIPYPDARQGGDLLPIIGPGWSLNAEMYFYAIFALTILIRRWQIVAMSVLFGGLVLLHPSNPIMGFYAQPRLLEFVGGMALGGLYQGKIVASTVCLAIVAAVNVVAHTGFILWLSIFAVGATVLIEIRGWLPRFTWLSRLGDASYSLYLVHVMVIEIAYEIAHRMLPLSTLSSVLFATVASGGTIAAALLLYRFVEQPILRRFSGSKASSLQRTTAHTPALPG